MDLINLEEAFLFAGPKPWAGCSISTTKSNKSRTKPQKWTRSRRLKGIRSPTAGQRRRWSGSWRSWSKRGEARGLEKRGLCSTLHKHEGHTSFPRRAESRAAFTLSPAQLKQILRSNFRPVRRGSVLNYSASRGPPRRTRSSESSDASNAPETQRYPLQKTVNTLHFPATDTCLFKYQRPAQMLWKTENNIFLTLHLDRRVKEKWKSGLNFDLADQWVSLNLFGVYCVCMKEWTGWMNELVSTWRNEWVNLMN